MSAPSERLVEAAGIEVEVRRGGQGAPPLVIHGELGVPGWLDAYRRLSESFDVIVPSLPGYGRSARPDGSWASAISPPGSPGLHATAAFTRPYL